MADAPSEQPTLTEGGMRGWVSRMKFPSRRLRRDTVLLMGGLLGVGHETVVSNGERPTLLMLFGAMIGLPAFLRKDEGKGDDK